MGQISVGDLGQNYSGGNKGNKDVRWSFLFFAVTCPRERQAGNVRRQVLLPRLIGEENENVACEPAAPRLLDFLLAIGGITRLQHLIDARRPPQYVEQAQTI